MDHVFDREDAKVELIQLLTQAEQREEAHALIANLDLTYGHHRKAQALGHIAQGYAATDVGRAQALVQAAWDTMDPFDRQNAPWRQVVVMSQDDDMVRAVAGAVARWNIAEAEEIISSGIKKEDKRRQARGLVCQVLANTNSEAAYSQVKEVFKQSVNKGLAEFWETFAAYAGALVTLLGIAGVRQFHEHLARVEAPIPGKEANFAS
jgi:hypothetical protein